MRAMVILFAVFFVTTDTDGGNNGGLGDRGRRDEATDVKSRLAFTRLRCLAADLEFCIGRFCDS